MKEQIAKLILKYKHRITLYEGEIAEAKQKLSRRKMTNDTANRICSRCYDGISELNLVIKDLEGMLNDLS